MKTQNIINTLNNPQYKGIIFDFDDTLYHLEVDWNSLKKTLTKTVKDKFGKKFIFTPIIKTLCGLRVNEPHMYNHILKIVESYELEGLEKGYPNESLVNFIRENKTKKIAIYTMNTTKTFHAFLHKYKFEGKFHSIITQQICKEPKPSALDIQHILNEWRYNKEEVIFIGNSHHDEQSGKLADVKTEIISI